MAQSNNTGQLTNSLLKTYSFQFDWGDPSINWQNGLWLTDLVLKNNTQITNISVKYFQDLSAYPDTPTIRVQTLSGIVLNTDVLPFANNVNKWKQGTGVTAAGVNIPTIAGVPNNDPVIMRATGFTVAAIGNPLSMEVSFQVIEFDF